MGRRRCAYCLENYTIDSTLASRRSMTFKKKSCLKKECETMAYEAAIEIKKEKKQQAINESKSDVLRCQTKGCNKVAEFKLNSVDICKKHHELFNGKNGIGKRLDSKLNSRQRSPIKRRATKSSNPLQFQFDKTKAAFQRLRRAECANELGYVKCVVTGKMFHWDNGSSVHGGHWIAAKNKNTTFCKWNVWPQSAGSNMNMDDVIVSGKYTEFMEVEFGKKQLDKFRALSKIARHYSIVELVAMESDFKDQLDHLLKTRCI